MPRPTDNDLLARYLRGDIDARQEAELERRATSDPDLQAALDGINATPEHDHAASVARMMAAARGGNAAVEQPVMLESGQAGEAKVRRLPRYWWAAAAALLLLVAIVFLLPGWNDSEGPSALAREADLAPATADAAEPLDYEPSAAATVEEEELATVPPAEVAAEDVAPTPQASPARPQA